MLAIDGGSPIRQEPLSPWPHFSQPCVDAASRVLASGKVSYWTGTEGRRFEEEFAQYLGSAHAVAVSNGTIALELALRALGVGPGDEVIVPCKTFIASASCVALCGATPVMADIDSESQNLTVSTLEAARTPKTKAIIAVHLVGWPCDMSSIMSFAKQHQLWVIEDCAQAHGASIDGQKVGTFGDIGCFSFCQDKILTTAGEGGLITCQDEALWKTLWSLKDHGKNYDTVYHKKHPPGFQWLHESFGTNGRMTEIQAAVGRVCLPLLDDWVAKRREHAHWLTKQWQHPALNIPLPPENFFHAYYKYYVFIKSEKLKSDWTRDRIMRSVAAEGIPCFSGICSEIYLEKAFDGLRPSERLPVAKSVGESCLLFLVHPTMSSEEIQQTGDALLKVLDVAVKEDIC